MTDLDEGLDSGCLILEAALLTSPEPLPMARLRNLFEPEPTIETVNTLLERLAIQWQDRSLTLVQVAGGWRFQTRPAFAATLAAFHAEKPPRYSRAVMETLAIIAYRQPVTRGDIEDIRGVTVSPATLRTLEERGWIEVVGHRDSPGRPDLFATTRAFLDHLNLRSLQELPPFPEIASNDGHPTKTA